MLKNRGIATVEYILLLCVLSFSLLFAADIITRRIGGGAGIRDLPARAIESIERLFDDIKSEGIDY